MVFKAVQSGADGYLLKGDGVVKLTNCLKRILEGEPPISPQIARNLLSRFASEKQNTFKTSDTSKEMSEAKKNLTQLSARENQILALIAQGLVNKEIARESELSLYTINDVVKSIYRKLKINSRTQATNIAIESGLTKKKY